ncbi:hypothetical protein M011DRAFT_191734 [Sporormia fimetaria CBS 119925]|uniref:CTLH domain-containing protein n=1 Tax=Sporormia fimetaria CBS 119925 TaxID=1340428 RepID=A0A6A6V3L2_9PLEO|nr:hypothetical protein M011DRAFT_191734 [Sporormia fimetaria CBS 119925]
MSSTAASVAVGTPTQHYFDRRLDEIKVSKSAINSVVMDYLISEGYPRAAEKFAKEANIELPATEESIQVRVASRRAIHAGDIGTAIDLINDFNPQLLDTNPSLHFALLRSQLIELIRSCMSNDPPNITPALRFSQAQLAPRAAGNDEFLKDLELTMTLLLVLPSDGKLEQRFAQQLDPSFRRNLANQVNEAILESQGSRREAKLRSLVRLRMWAEDRAKALHKDLPSILPFGLQDTEEATNERDMHADPLENAADIMVM